MKKILMLILCMGMTIAFGACDLFNGATSSNSQTESSEGMDTPEDSSENSSEDIIDNSSEESSDALSSESSEDSVEDSSEESSSVTPPIVDGENEMPLVPIG